MSDFTIDDTPGGFERHGGEGPGGESGRENDRRRSAISFGAAVALHAAAIIAAAIVVSARPADTQLPPITVNVLFSGSALPSDQQAAGNSSGPAAPAASPGPAAAQAQSSSSGAGSGFVIPTPRAQPTVSAPASGSGFRQAGGTTGGEASLPSLQSQAPGATLPAAQSGSGSGTGSGPVQHSGQGVTVTSPSAGAGSGTLNLGKLDTAIAGSGTSGRGTGAAASGGTTSGGGGTSTSGGGGGGAAVAGGGYRVLWDQPDTGKGRTVVKTVDPKLPASVGKEGLTLRVQVSFVLGPDGLLSNVKVDLSSGYGAVDSAVVDAIRQWRFTAAPGSASITGLIPYIITLH